MPTSANTQLSNVRRYLRTSKLVKAVLIIAVMVAPIVRVSLNPNTHNIIGVVVAAVITIVIMTIIYGQDESDQEPPAGRK